MGYHSLRMSIVGGFGVFDLICQVLSLVGNGLVLSAVVSVKIGLVGYRRFLLSLLVNNLFLSGTHVVIVAYLNTTNETGLSLGCLGAFLDSVQLGAVYAALFNLCGMSADHYVGIVHPLHYEHLMNKRIARIAPIIIWIVAFVFGFADLAIAGLVFQIEQYIYIDSRQNFLAMYNTLLNMPSKNCPKNETTTATPLLSFNSSGDDNLDDEWSEDFRILLQLKGDVVNSVQDTRDWCMISYSYKLTWVQWLRLFCTMFSFLFVIVCYGACFVKIYYWGTAMDFNRHESVHQETSLSSVSKIVRSHSSHQQHHSFKNNQSSRKFLRVTLLLLSVFAICWLPFVVFDTLVNSNLSIIDPQLVSILNVPRLHILHHIFYSLFLLYPLCDAIICTSRVRAIRMYISEILRNRRTSLSGSGSGAGNNTDASVVSLPRLSRPVIASKRRSTFDSLVAGEADRPLAELGFSTSNNP